MRANNSELFIQQIQIMLFVQLKQGFSCERVEYVVIHVLDRTENHHRETAIPCFKPKDSMLNGTAS